VQDEAVSSKTCILYLMFMDVMHSAGELVLYMHQSVRPSKSPLLLCSSAR
jgi:hypothetical protein